VTIATSKLHATLASTYLLNAVAYRRTCLLLVTAAGVRRIITRAQRHLCFNKSVFLAVGIGAAASASPLEELSLYAAAAASFCLFVT